MGKQSVEEAPSQNKKSKATRFVQEAEETTDSHPRTWKTNAVIYIGHLPYGFLEEQMKSYFEQFGTVLAVKVCRSKKTARSKGYGFVQFEFPYVAKIAAETMHHYMLLGKILQCHTLPANQVNPFTHRYMKRKTKYINWKRIFVSQRNKKRTPAEMKEEVSKLLMHEYYRRNRLKELGIQYDFPGYSSILNN